MRASFCLSDDEHKGRRLRVVVLSVSEVVDETRAGSDSSYEFHSPFAWFREQFSEGRLLEPGNCKRSIPLLVVS